MQCLEHDKASLHPLLPFNYKILKEHLLINLVWKAIIKHGCRENEWKMLEFDWLSLNRKWVFLNNATIKPNKNEVRWGCIIGGLPIIILIVRLGLKHWLFYWLNGGRRHGPLERNPRLVKDPLFSLNYKMFTKLVRSQSGSKKHPTMSSSLIKSLWMFVSCSIFKIWCPSVGASPHPSPHTLLLDYYERSCHPFVKLYCKMSPKHWHHLTPF